MALAMTAPFAVPRWPRRFSRQCLPWLCLVWLLVSDAVGRHLSFVHGWTGHRARQVTGRFSEEEPWSDVLTEDSPEEIAAKSLTTKIKHLESAKELINILHENLDDPIFNFYHATAAYSSLTTWKKRRDLHQDDWDESVIARLHAKVLDMVEKGELNAKASANVLWSIAKFSDWSSIPSQLLLALAESMPSKIPVMDARGLSNTLLACAHLHEQEPSVLQMLPAMVAQIPVVAKDMKAHELSSSLWACGQLMAAVGDPAVPQAVPALVSETVKRAKDMKPQELSNCLWACAELKDDAPEVLEMLPAMVAEIPGKLEHMNAQNLCNSLEALVLLQDLVPEVRRLVTDHDSEDILRSAAERLNRLLPNLSGKDLNIAVPAVLWACARAGVYPSGLLLSVAECFGSPEKVSSLPGFSLCALSWAYQALDSEGKFEDFRQLMTSAVSKRGFTGADVESSKLGHLGWNHANGRRNMGKVSHASVPHA